MTGCCDAESKRYGTRKGVSRGGLPELQGLVYERKLLTVRQAELAEMLKDVATAYIDARDVCHTEVSVVIGGNALAMNQAMRSVRFRTAAQGPKIDMSSLDT